MAGIRLVPIVVFVQRIARLLRDAGQDLKTLVERRILFKWYLKQVRSRWGPGGILVGSWWDPGEILVGSWWDLGGILVGSW